VRPVTVVNGPFACDNGGFTLLELVIVVFIISLMAALVFPSFTQQADRKVKSDAGKIASLFRYLNDTAIYTKKTYYMKFELPDECVVWNGPEGEKKEEVKSLRSITLQSKGEVKEGEVVLFFGPAGLQENIDIRLAGEGENMMVSFNAISGRARVIDKEE
jgi:general secretion pathway protein H